MKNLAEQFEIRLDEFNGVEFNYGVSYPTWDGEDTQTEVYNDLEQAEKRWIELVQCEVREREGA